ncbi:hypothetical protein SAY87_029249 [Trapa incisa]|uniref:Formin-like protein n=1 Tax=Trapa incisa TaxID=236973 RepID=A0AAN7QST0_9MYRT|nr:hypothetical protein SAY87_029249 [Trapa incisa]
MALFRKLLYRKPPDGLLEICEKVYGLVLLVALFSLSHAVLVECELVKIDINCHVQGDIVVECIHLCEDMECEVMMFRIMFYTAFIRSNIMMLNRDEIDMLWDAKDLFPKEFRVELLFSEMDADASIVPSDLSCFGEKEGLPVEAFAKVKEMFNHLDWLDPVNDAALHMLQKINTSNIAPGDMRRKCRHGLQGFRSPKAIPKYQERSRSQSSSSCDYDNPLAQKTSPHGSMDASDSQSMMVFANSKQDPPKLVFENQTSLPASTTRNLLPDNDTLQGSLWAEAQTSDDATKAPEIDMLELENLFAASVPASDSGRMPGQHSSNARKQERVQLIDHRQAYNCEIMLSKVKVPLPELMGLVFALEESVLDIDQVENLIKFCPTKEEMELLKGYYGEKDKLGKCEQFFIELMQVPRAESKFRVFSFKMQFQSQVSDLRSSLNVVNSAAEKISDSLKLKRIMQTTLSLGNALNEGTARGSAIGFRLDSLLKLTDTRAMNNKMTLMHYLCKHFVAFK